jgi:hypothetical protein
LEQDMITFQRPEHQAVATALGAMASDLLLRCRCWFGGGTAIVLDLGEYRLSKDIDFLCADADGYRTLRSLVVAGGAAALFRPPVREVRAFRCDQYGIRGIVSAGGVPLRFEIIREARIPLDGLPHPRLGVPRLDDSHQIAEKLLANADRCRDRATAFRDAADLGMLAALRGPFPADAVVVAERAYGDDIARQLGWALDRLAEAAERRHAATVLGMEATTLDQAVDALRQEYQRIWSGTPNSASDARP